jgi:hypothetical protein
MRIREAHPLKQGLKLRIKVVLFLFLFIPLTASPVSSTIITISEDAQAAYSSPTTNYGSGLILSVASGTSSSICTYSYIKFNMPKYSSISSAVLHLYDAGNPTGTPTINVYTVSSSWSESSITWNNAPNPGSLIVSGGAGAGWRSYNVLGGMSSGNLSFVLVATTSTSLKAMAFRSKEYDNGNYTGYLDVSYIADNNNTNSIIISNTSNYNNAITSTNSPNIYITTWVNNSNWGFWSPFIDYVQVIRPDGYEYTALVSETGIWGQNAYQQQYSLSPYLGSTMYGDWTFNLMHGVFPEVIATTTLTYVNPADAPSTISLSLSGNNVTLDYWTNPINRNIANLEYSITYDTLSPNPSYNNPLCSSSSVLGCAYPVSWNGSKDITNFIIDKYYFSSNTVILHAYTKYNGIIIAQSDKSYRFEPIFVSPIPTPTYAPIPTNTPTYTPMPTFTPIVYENNTNNSAFNGSPMGNLSEMGTIANSSIGNIHSIGTSVNARITSYDYSKSQIVYTYFFPAIFNIIPIKIWLLIILGWALELTCIFLKR